MAVSQPGAVYIIGAGPGAPDLITVRGKQLLHSCDVVLFDNLVPHELIVTLPSAVERYYVGKRSGAPCLSQDKINALMVKLARQGKTVARLKGSDPLIFGRGAEEARCLKENGVRFEIVPGVTSGIAAAAYAGIPCTDREKASFVLFVTGHKAQEKQVSSVPWEWVAQAGSGTAVIYMGVSEIRSLTAKLTDAGMAESTAAAVIERGTFPSQRVFISTLGELATIVARNRIRPPAIFVLGEVVTLRPLIDWFYGRPLMGVRVMVTRPADQAQDMYDRLRALGAEVLAYPTIATEEFLDRPAWQALRDLSSGERWLVFTSENGVRYFMRQYFGMLGDMRGLAGYKIAVVGSGTAAALGRYHLKADFVPTRATTAALAEQLTGSKAWQDTTVVRVRGDLSVDNVDRSLTRAGASLIQVTVYRTVMPTWPAEFKEKLLEYPPDMITFTSGTSVEGLFRNLTEGEIKEIAGRAKLASIGPTTTKVAETRGLQVAIEAGEHTIPAMIQALVEYAADHPVWRRS